MGNGAEAQFASPPSPGAALVVSLPKTLFGFWGISLAPLPDEEMEPFQDRVLEQNQPHGAMWRSVSVCVRVCVCVHVCAQARTAGVFEVVTVTKQTLQAFSGWTPGMLNFR